VLLRLSILAAEAPGAGVAEETTNPIIPEANEILWAALFFALLYFALRYLLVPPIQRMVREREEKIRGDLDAAEQTRDQLVAAQADYEAALAGARAEADGLIEAARAEADGHRARLQAQADAEIAVLRQQAQAEIAASRQQAVSAMRGDVIDLAVGAASAVVQRPIDRASAVAVVEQALRAN
jgi:F-type H+-transporting ATPase subunit b